MEVLEYPMEIPSSLEPQSQAEEREFDEAAVNTEYSSDMAQEEESAPVSHEIRKAPPFNCKEKIVLCVDVSSDMKSESLGQGKHSRSFLQAIKSSLQIFLATKKILNAEHEYALVLMQDNTILWLQDFTNNYQHISEMVNDLEAGDESELEETTFDFNQVVSLLKEHCEIPEVDDLALPPPFVFRTIFIYGRSNCELRISPECMKEFKEMKASPYFFLDVLYVHELPSISNKAQKIYDFFCDLDKEEKGYILEVSNSIKILYETLAKLICHPLQRSPQNEAFYNPMPVFQERGTVGQYS